MYSCEGKSPGSVSVSVSKSPAAFGRVVFGFLKGLWGGLLVKVLKAVGVLWKVIEVQ